MRQTDIIDEERGEVFSPAQPAEIPEELQKCEFCEHWGEHGHSAHPSLGSCEVLTEIGQIRGRSVVFTAGSTSCPHFDPNERCKAVAEEWAEEDRADAAEEASERFWAQAAANGKGNTL